GFDLADEKFQQELKAKEVIVKDAIISVMGSKDMTQLGNSLYRDTLRIQITERIKKLIPNVEIGNVYFSKYILQ
ncbi:MAG: flagellar basal body-associated FliL family protein, partial [Bacteroidota bacterium]